MLIFDRLNYGIIAGFYAASFEERWLAAIVGFVLLYVQMVLIAAGNI